MLKKLEPIIFLFILVLLTLLGCSGPKESNDSVHEGKTPSLVSLTKPLTYSKNQAIIPLVLNNTGDPVVRCTINPDLPNGLEIAADSGSCRITGTLTVTLVQTTFTITGTDAQGQTDTATVSIVVNDETPSKNRSPSLVSITDSLVYFKDQTIIPLVVNNTGDPAVSCAITPDLPDGLAIVPDSGNCQITGTPTVTLIQTTFTVTGTDAEGETDTATVSIAVKTPPPSLVSIITIQTYFRGQAIAALDITNIGDPAVSCTINPNLPDGLAIAPDSGNCQITGIPTVTLAETEFTITGTDAQGETDTATVSIVINDGTPSLADVAVLQTYFKDHVITALDITNIGDPVISCTINPNLPDGLAIAPDSGNCQITGIPTVTLAETEFTITGTDAQGETDTATVSIVINDGTPSLADVAVLQTYFKDHVITALDITNIGDPVISCAVKPNLPAGLLIAADSGNCQITGIPTVTLAETEFTITGTDAQGETDTATVSIVIKIPLPSLINITEPPVYFRGQAITPLVISNTGDPAINCVSNPDLPVGLVIAADNGNCRITGTPTVALTKTDFTITGTDAQGQTDTAKVPIIIRGWSTSILSPTFPLATASDTTITIQTDRDSRISIHRGLNCSGGQVVSENVSDITSNVEITLPASSLKNDNTDTDFSNFFTLCQEDKTLSNAVVKITSFMVHSLLSQKNWDGGALRIGDIWSKVFVRVDSRHEADKSRYISSYSHLVWRLFGTFTTGRYSSDKRTVFEIDPISIPEHFKRLGRATARFYYNYDGSKPTPFSSATSFYIGKDIHNGKTYYIMATNHHVLCNPLLEFALNIVCSPGIKHIGTNDGSDKGGFYYFPVYGYGNTGIYFIGAWQDIDFALYAFELTSSQKMNKEIDMNLTNARLEFDFTSDIYPGQELVTAGFGWRYNPVNRTDPIFGRDSSLMFSFDDDCRVFSPRNGFDKVSPRVFLFANGCDVSQGDSGSAVMDRKTGKIVGIHSSSAKKSDTNPNIKNSEYIHTHYMNKKDAFTNLARAVPAPKIKTFLEDWVTKNNATLSEIQKRLLRKFLDKDLE